MRRLFLLILLLWLPAAVLAAPITYQGQLQNESGPVTGTPNMSFRLYDSLSGGSLVGSVVNQDNVPVTDGLFSVELDFGEVFEGTSLFLEVSVEGQTLVPRQPIATAPMAHFAMTPAGPQGPEGPQGPQGPQGPKGPEGSSPFEVDPDSGAISYVFENTGFALDVGQRTAMGYAGNEATESGATVSGGGADGFPNVAGDEFATVGGGLNNLATGPLATISGGQSNVSSGERAYIGGGSENHAEGVRSVIGGGRYNDALGDFSVVGGGVGHLIEGELGTVAGGLINTASGSRSTIGGGEENTASHWFSTVAGGHGNSASGNVSAVGGGKDNQALGTGGYVGGGVSNEAYFSGSTIGGGNDNLAGEFATVAGGRDNTASGAYATVGGGQNNCAGGWYSWAGGLRAKVRPGSDSGPAGIGCSGVQTYDWFGDYGTFVWAGLGDSDFTSTGPNQFLIRASGGVGINTNSPARMLHMKGNTDQTPTMLFESEDAPEDRRIAALFMNVSTGHLSIGRMTDDGNSLVSTHFQIRANNGYVGIGRSGNNISHPLHMASGAHVTAGGTWVSSSDADAKTDFRPVNPDEILAGVMQLPITYWKYRAQPDVSHVGPTAQDFHAAFGLGENDTSIATVDSAGVALAAIQGLHGQLEQKRQQIEDLNTRQTALATENAELRQLAERNAALENRLARLESLLIDDLKIAEVAP